MAESAHASFGLVEIVDDIPLSHLNSLHNKLGDSFASFDREWLSRISVDQHDMNLSSVTAIDGARAVERRDPVFRSQP